MTRAGASAALSAAQARQVALAAQGFGGPGGTLASVGIRPHRTATASTARIEELQAEQNL